MWRRRQPASLGKAILVAVKAWRLLHVQLHAAVKKTVIGRRLCVYWPDDSLWYCGIINDFDTKDDKHLVHYDDDKDEWLLLKDEIVHIFHSAEEVRLAARTPPRLAWSSAPACPDPLTPTTTPIHHHPPLPPFAPPTPDRPPLCPTRSSRSRIVRLAGSAFAAAASVSSPSPRLRCQRPQSRPPTTAQWLRRRSARETARRARQRRLLTRSARDPPMRPTPTLAPGVKTTPAAPRPARRR